MDTQPKKQFWNGHKFLNEEEAVAVVEGIVLPCAKLMRALSRDDRLYLSPHLLEGDDVVIKMLLLFDMDLWTKDNIDRMKKKNDLQLIGEGYLKPMLQWKVVTPYFIKWGNFNYFQKKVKESNNPALLRLLKKYYN